MNQSETPLMRMFVRHVVVIVNGLKQAHHLMYLSSRNQNHAVFDEQNSLSHCGYGRIRLY